MIEDYFLQIENILRDFPVIHSHALTQKVYNQHQGYISGKIFFENGHLLEFIEVIDTEQADKVKYRYHYMDEMNKLVFRYDNAPHHNEVNSFPHHKHLPDRVTASCEPELRAVLMEIAQFQRKKR